MNADNTFDKLMDYIEQWSINELSRKDLKKEIKEAVKQAEQAAFEEGRKQGHKEAMINQYRDRNDEADQRYIDGQREMRESVINTYIQFCKFKKDFIIKQLRALPIAPRGGEK